MVDIITPQNKKDLLSAVSWSIATQSHMEIVGGGSKATLGRPTQNAAILDMSAFNSIREYDPTELFIKAGAATPITDIINTIESENQMLAFEPIDFSALLNLKDKKSTIMGALSTNFSGPRRIKAGAARDHFLGFEGVSGRAETFKAGGQVVKNVTGYDLCKLLCGSWGTLGVVDTVSVKVLPAPEKIRTLIIYGLNEEEANNCFTSSLNSPNEISGAAWLPSSMSKLSSVEYISTSGSSITAMRLEGVATSVQSRMIDLQKRLKNSGEMTELHSSNSRKFWREIRDIIPFTFVSGQVIWRLSIPPNYGGKVANRIKGEFESIVFMDWGGASLWVQLQMSSHNALDLSSKIHNIARQAGGHATCIRAPASIRNLIDVFPTLNKAEYNLTRRIKEGFDPKGIFNFGRMYAEF